MDLKSISQRMWSDSSQDPDQLKTEPERIQTRTLLQKTYFGKMQESMNAT